MVAQNKNFSVKTGLDVGGYITSVNGVQPTNGQLMIGDATNHRFSVANLSSSNGVIITNGAGTIQISTNGATANTPSTLVLRDASGNFTAGTITGALAGNASTATKLQTARTINGTSFDGSANISFTSDSVAEGTTNQYFTNTRVRGAVSATGSLNYNSSTGVFSFTDAVTTVFGRSGAVVLQSSDVTTALGYTPMNKGGDTISGDLIITGNLTINGTTTSVNATTINVEDPIIAIGGGANGSALTSDDGKDRGIGFQWHNGTTAKTGFFGFDRSTQNFLFIPDATITGEVVSGTTGTLQANVSGNVTGNLTGNVTGTVSGNAGTATKLATARTINGASFDGTANISFNSDAVAEGTTNLYYTTARARSSISATGSLNYNSSTGVLSYAESVNSVFGRTGAVVLTSSDISTALGYTPASSSGGTFTGPVNIKSIASVDSVSTAITNTAKTTVDTIALASARSVKYMVQVSDDSTGDTHVEELLIVTNGSTAYTNQYGYVYTSAALGTFSADVVSTNLVLSFQATAASNKTVRVVRIALTA